MDEHKFCFIICSNNDFYLTECFHFLSLLDIPDGYTADTLVITDAASMAAGYNEGMRASDARYKIYLHQDTFIRNRHFLRDIVAIFQSDRQIGMIGMIGAEHLCWDGVMWHERRIGNFYRMEKMLESGEKYNIQIIKEGIVQVEVVDGLMMVTQYDIPWREDIVSGWDFYDVSQCLEFRRAGYKIVVPGQAKAWYIHDCEIPSLWNYEAARKIVRAAYPDFFPPKKSFLFCPTDRIKMPHITWGLLELGYEVRMDNGKAHIQQYNEQDKDDFAERLKSHNCDYVISFNLSPEIAQACYEEGVPYIAWCYDSPLKELNGWFATYPTTHIFAMDKQEIKKLAGKKLPHLHYMHLAANTALAKGLVISEADEKAYSHDVSMVGNLYIKQDYKELLPQDDEEIRADMEAFVNDPVGDWQAKTKIFNRLSDETVRHLSGIMDAKKSYNMDNRHYYEALMARDITQRDRVLILGELAREHEVHLYASSSEKIPENVHAHGYVDAYNEALKVFHLSKINLNITLRSIESGIPQRVFDVMSVGGFMISNYQQDLAELFVPDKEIVLFRTVEELKKKVNYYLRHEKERLTIAMAGYRKVSKYYSYARTLEKIIKIVDEDRREMSLFT